MTTVLPPDVVYLVCGCPGTANHRNGCDLGKAEDLVLAVLAECAANGWSAGASLRAVVGALVDADQLRPVADGLWQVVMGLLDDLWEASILAGSPPAVPTPAAVGAS